VPHDGELYWQLRTLRPGQQEVFRQLTDMIKQPVAAAAEANITAFAEFTDADGQWWRCDEDGEVNKRQTREVSQGPGLLMLQAGLGRIPGLARPASDAQRNCLHSRVLGGHPGCGGAVGQLTRLHGTRESVLALRHAELQPVAVLKCSTPGVNALSVMASPNSH